MEYAPIIILIVFLAIFAFLLTKVLNQADRISELESHIMRPYNPKWHDLKDLPCPGSLIVMQEDNGQERYGYAVGLRGRPAFLMLENHLQLFRTTARPKLIEYSIFKKWAYIEQRIRPTEVLSTYEQQYKVYK